MIYWVRSELCVVIHLLNFLESIFVRHLRGVVGVASPLFFTFSSDGLGTKCTWLYYAKFDGLITLGARPSLMNFFM